MVGSIVLDAKMSGSLPLEVPGMVLVALAGPSTACRACSPMYGSHECVDQHPCLEQCDAEWWCTHPRRPGVACSRSAGVPSRCDCATAAPSPAATEHSRTCAAPPTRGTGTTTWRVRPWAPPLRCRPRTWRCWTCTPPALTTPQAARWGQLGLPLLLQLLQLLPLLLQLNPAGRRVQYSRVAEVGARAVLVVAALVPGLLSGPGLVQLAVAATLVVPLSELGWIMA